MVVVGGGLRENVKEGGFERGRMCEMRNADLSPVDLHAVRLYTQLSIRMFSLPCLFSAPHIPDSASLAAHYPALANGVHGLRNGYPEPHLRIHNPIVTSRGLTIPWRAVHSTQYTARSTQQARNEPTSNRPRQRQPPSLRIPHPNPHPPQDPHGDPSPPPHRGNNTHNDVRPHFPGGPKAVIRIRTSLRLH